MTGEDRLKLVAYLDGELDEAESRKIETRVSRNPEARREAEALKATWGLLDLLPKIRPSEDLSSKTLTAISHLDFPVVPVAAPSGPIAAERRPAAWIVACIASLLLAIGAGYTITRWAWPDPNARLIRQLSLAEHLDEYRDAGSLEFLDALEKSREFDDAE